MKSVYFNVTGGASGDMLLAVLSALGADLKAIENQINGFFPERISIKTVPEMRGGITGNRVDVSCLELQHEGAAVLGHHHHAPTQTGHTHGGHHHHPHAHDSTSDHEHGKYSHAEESPAHHHHRSFKDIRALIEGSSLSEQVKKLSFSAFQFLAEAEGAVHGRSPDEVHFHEVGAWDSVADMIGACLAMEQLGVEAFGVSPLPCGIGTIQCAHGEMPNPAPATQKLLVGFRTRQTEEPFELVTPTAAALFAAWKKQFAPISGEPTVLKTANAFGQRTLKVLPNMLCAVLGETGGAKDTLLVLETNLDDCSSEIIGHLFDILFAAGALDVWTTAIGMKKNRPGTLLSVLVSAEKAEHVRELIFRGTPTFGIRYHAVDREALERRFEKRITPFGEITVKVGAYKGEDITVSPEFESCRKLAAAKGIPLRKLYE